MITFTCPTCESTLIAQDEQLIGKILACPKCGSMVLVQSPDEAPTPQYVAPPRPRVHKRFPDVLTHETGSGVMGPTANTSHHSDLLVIDELPISDVPETEVKTRKVLVGILLGLLVLLLIALGFLMLFRKPIPPKQQPAPQNPIAEAPVEPLPPEPAVEPEPIEPEPIAPEAVESDPSESAKEIEPTSEGEPSSTESTEKPEPIETSDQPAQESADTLSSFERKMPDLIDSALPNIDIEAKLALPILELTIEQQHLIDFVRTMSRLTGVQMTLHIDDIKPIPLSLTTPVSGHFTESTAGSVLTETLVSIGLQWIAEDRQITILPKETPENVELTFDVSDFAELADDLIPEVLAKMVQQLVCPEFNITALDTQQLSVQQNDEKEIHQRKNLKRLRGEILRLLEQLRAIRKMPPKTELAGKALAPEAFGWDQVMKPITLHYYHPVPLAQVIEQLETQTKMTILVDHQSLHRALSSYAAMLSTVQCNGGTVNDALVLSLSSVDSATLAYRIIDHQTLEITTAESLRQPDKMTVEVHRYFLQEDETPEDIVRSLRGAVEPNSWFVAEKPETRYGGNVVIDHPSGCLLVRQSQSVQQQIRLYLSSPEM